MRHVGRFHKSIILLVIICSVAVLGYKWLFAGFSERRVRSLIPLEFSEIIRKEGLVQNDFKNPLIVLRDDGSAWDVYYYPVTGKSIEISFVFDNRTYEIKRYIRETEGGMYRRVTTN